MTLSLASYSTMVTTRLPRRAASKDAALARCRAMGISCVTVEMVLFEWLEAAGTDEFKAVSALVK